jgi:hypothetical protein
MEILPGATLAWLAVLGAGKSFKGHHQAMRDQICVRIHVYEIKEDALLAIGSQETADEQTRLAEGPKAIVVLLLPRFPPPPLPYPARPRAEATALDMQHKGRISDAITQLIRLTSAGSFKPARSKVPTAWRLPRTSNSTKKRQMHATGWTRFKQDQRRGYQL